MMAAESRAADLMAMKQAGCTKVAVANDKEAYGLGVASTTRNASESVGKSPAKTIGFTSW